MTARRRRAVPVALALALASASGCDAIFGVTPGGAGADAAPGGDGDGGVVSDAGIDGALVDDLDDDGVTDRDDNCPLVTNGEQWDEDGDQTGDACDPCPHLAGDVRDADDDMVGDACDPGTTPHQWALFDGFHDPLVLTTCTGVAQLGWWCGRMGGMTAMPSATGGVLTMPHETVLGAVNSLTLLHPIPVSQAVRVVTELDVGLYDPNQAVVAARVLVQASTLNDPKGAAYALCGLNQGNNGMQLQAALGGRSGTIGSRVVPASGVFDAQQVTLEMDRTTLRCRMGTTVATLTLPPPSSGDAVTSIGPAAGLWTVGTGMTVPYFGVIRARP